MQVQNFKQPLHQICQIAKCDLIIKNKQLMSLKPGTSLSYLNMIRKMFEQVQSSLKHLLGYLSSMYQMHGINFDVNPMYNTILRIVTPFELQTYFKLSNPSALISANDTDKKFQKRNLPNGSQKLLENQVKIEDPSLKNYIPMQSSQARIQKKEREKVSGFLRNEKNQKEKVYSEQSGKIFGKSTIYRLNSGGKPALSQKEEVEVCEFIEDQVRKGKPLSMNIIAHEAKRIAYKTPYFKASQGWVKNFFVRHPAMRELYKISRLNKNTPFLPPNFSIDSANFDQSSLILKSFKESATETNENKNNVYQEQDSQQKQEYSSMQIYSESSQLEDSPQGES